MRTQMLKLSFLKSFITNSRILLIFFWLMGLLTGLVIANHPSVSFSCWDQRFSFNITAGSLLVSVFAPVMISYVFVRFLNYKLIFLLAFLKAFSYSFLSLCMIYVFGNAGWIVWFLLFSSDSVLVILLMFFWIRNIFNKHFIPRFDAIFLVLGAIFTYFADYFILLPLLNELSTSI